MTLCLAAECRRHRHFFNALVFATDQKIEGEIASADIGRKLVTITGQWYPILMAGTQTRALSLIDEIGRAIQRFETPPGKDDIPPPWEHVLQLAVMQQKNNIAQEIVSTSFGITYDEFLKAGKAAFPEDIHREVISEIAKAPLDCWLLVLAFAHTDARLYRIGPTGTVESCENFAAIGSGYYVAEASLFQRSQNVQNDLGTTIYNVYEAMKLGSIAPGVGAKFQIGVAEWEWYEQPNPYNHGEVKLSFLTPDYYNYLGRQFARYAPRPVQAVGLRPRWIKERDRALVLTPKGELSPEHKKKAKLAQAAREREARKRAAKQSASQA